jgi:PAS domain S-box-containing protein
MNFLDIRTVLFSTILSGLICMLVIASLWRQNRQFLPELGFWLADFVMQFVAILLVTLRGILPDFLSIVAANALILGGALLLYLGLERFSKRTSRQWPNYLYLAGFILVNLYFTFFQPSLPARNINLSLGLLVICAQCAWLLLRRVDTALRPETRPAGTIFLIYSLVSLARIFVDLTVPAETDLFESGLYDVLAVLIYQMLSIGLAFTLLLLVNRRLFAEVKNDLIRQNQAEEEIRRLSRFPAENPNPVLRIAQDGVILYANAASAPILAVWGRQVGQAIPDDWQAQIASIFEADESREVEINAQELVFSCSLAPIAETGYLNLYGRDITAHKRMEAEVARSAEAFTKIFQEGAVALALTEIEDGTILDVNQKWLELTGYQRETVLGKSAAQHGGWKSLEEREKLRHHLVKYGEVNNWEATCLRPNGEEYIVMVAAKIINLHGKQILLSSSLDITERKHAETLLAQLAAIVDSSDDAIIGKTLEGQITSWNSGAERLYGYTAGEIIGQPIALLIPSDRPDELPDILAKLKRGEGIKHFETVRQRKDGSRLSISVTISPIKNASGQIIGASTIARDITAQKEANDAILASETRYRHTLDAMLEGCQILGFDWRYVYLNDAADKHNRRPKTELLGQKYMDMWPGIEDTQVFAVIRSCMEDRQPQSMENEFTFPNGSKGWFELNIYPVPEGIVILSMDISERKWAEEALRQYSTRLETEVAERTRELREAQEKLVRQERLAVLGQLAGSIGHELRNPLGVISNAVYYLKLAQPEASEKIKEYLDILEKETRISDKIITDLLDFTRLKSADRRPAAVADLIRQTLERNPAPPPVRVTLEIPPDLPKVFADHQQIVQVLGNLVANAYQALVSSETTQEPKLTISATLQGDMMKIALQDTGPGIQPENMARLFQPLFTTKIKGIGLGLAISQKLALANDGQIQVQSQPGVGSTFTVSLPVYVSVPDLARDVSVPDPARAKEKK